MPLDSLKEVQQKLGRNVLLFQQMELCLKHLLTVGNISVTSKVKKNETSSDLLEFLQKQIEEKLEQKAASVARVTLGNLVVRASEEIFCTPEETIPEVEDETDDEVGDAVEDETYEIVHSSSFNVDDPAFSQLLKDFRQERNETIHHFLTKFDLSSTEGVSGAIQYLDEQHQRLLLPLKKIQDYVTSMRDGQCYMAALSDLPAFPGVLCEFQIIDLLTDSPYAGVVSPLRVCSSR